MRQRHRKPLLTGIATAIALAATVTIASPSVAVLDGTQDRSGLFPNVGALEVGFEDEGETFWFKFCSGTLIAPDLVLTAAHCTAGFVDPSTGHLSDALLLRVNFAASREDEPLAYEAADVIVHPGWFEAPALRGNSKHLGLASPAEDIALVLLQDAVTGIAPSPIAGRDYFDGVRLTDEQFTVVGYGLNDFVTGSAGSARPEVVANFARTYRTDVTVITEHDAFPDRFFKITSSICLGDSGGPLLHEGVVVGINVWGNSPRCTAAGYSYRVDSAIAQEFLAAHL